MKKIIPYIFLFNVALKAAEAEPTAQDMTITNNTKYPAIIAITTFNCHSSKSEPPKLVTISLKKMEDKKISMPAKTEYVVFNFTFIKAKTDKFAGGEAYSTLFDLTGSAKKLPMEIRLDPKKYKIPEGFIEIKPVGEGKISIRQSGSTK